MTAAYITVVQVEPASPQPSVDRLSVTFALEERSVCSDSSVKMNVFNPGSPPGDNMDKDHFPREPTATGCPPFDTSLLPSFCSSLSVDIQQTVVSFVSSSLFIPFVSCVPSLPLSPSLLT